MFKIENYGTRDGSVLAAQFIRIPEDVILYNDPKIVETFIFFACKADRFNEVNFSVNYLVSWCGYKPDTHKGRNNDRFIESIKNLCQLGYISLCDNFVELSNKPDILITAIFQLDYVDKRINEIQEKNDKEKDEAKTNNLPYTKHGAFAILYYDEIIKIIKHTIKEKFNAYVNVSALCTVFAYLRLMIYLRTKNGAKEDNNNINYAEAHYEFYYEIADKLHISVRSLSKLLHILYKELNLIYYEHTHVKLDSSSNAEYITLPTIFCNMYQRGKGNAELQGEYYYKHEIELKAQLLYKCYEKQYGIKKLIKNKKKTVCEYEETDVVWYDLDIPTINEYHQQKGGR